MILLVRHGQTLFNAEGRLQGSLDSPLSDEGLHHARSLGALIRSLIGRNTDSYAIVSSPLGRAKATAEIVSREAGIERITLDRRLAEVSFGEWDGHTKEEIDARWPGMWQSSVRLTWATGCPGAESYEAAIERAADWLDSYRNQPVIAVSHGVMGSLLRGVYARLARDQILRLPVPYDAVFALRDGRADRIDRP